MKRGREGEGERGGEGDLADGLFLQYCSIFRNVLKTVYFFAHYKK